MAKPNFISSADWQLVLKYAVDFSNEEYLIAAIGWHETNWGTAPNSAGRNWIFGYGYYGDPVVAAKWKGIEKQMQGLSSMLRDYFVPPITQTSIMNFSINHYRSGNPEAWARSVYSIYSGLVGVEPEIPPEEIPEEIPPGEVPEEVPGEVPTGEAYLGAQVVPTESETVQHWKNTFDKIATGCSTYILLAIIMVIIIVIFMRY